MAYMNEWNLYVQHGPPKPTLLEVFMINSLVSWWPKPLFFMVLGAHGIYIPIYISTPLIHPWKLIPQKGTISIGNTSSNHWFSGVYLFKTLTPSHQNHSNPNTTRLEGDLDLWHTTCSRWNAFDLKTTQPRLGLPRDLGAWEKEHSFSMF